jgi:RimJ/RimL family protein N-acetyltransferase
MSSGGLRLEPGTEADIPFVMATERRPGYEQFVGRWDEGRHRQALREQRYTYFVASDGSERVGFAIVRDWNSPEGTALIKRVAVADPGRGIGRALLRAVVARAFEETSAYRLWLGVFPENLRARRAYEAVGFVAEGIARGSAFFGGEHRDELVMSMLRPDWDAKRNRAS